MLLLVVAAALSACGSNDASSKSKPDSASSTTAVADTEAPRCGDGSGKPATGTPIPVGGMMTSAGGADTSQGPKTAAAYFKCLNDNGGIDGRPVSYTIVNDGLNPAGAARSGTTLVEDKKVVAVIGSTAYLECPVAGPIYAKARVVEIESAGGSAQCFTSPNIASTAQGGTLDTSASIAELIDRGAKTFSVLAPNTPGLGDAFLAAAKRTAEALGGKIVKTTLFQPGIRDATSLVLAAASANPDAILYVGISQDAVTVLKAAQAQDMKSRFKFGCAAPCYTPDLPKLIGSYWDGALRVPHQFASFDATSPDNALWNRVMEKYAPGVTRDEFSQASFVAAKMFADTISKLQGPITVATVGKALKSISDYKTDMLCAPWYFGDTPYHVANHAGPVAEIDSGGWTDVAGCTESKDPILKPILAAENNK